MVHLRSGDMCPALPCILQAQAQTLVSKFGVSQQVHSLLRQMWLAHLPHTGMLEPLPCHPTAAGAGAGAGAGAAAAGQTGQGGDDDMEVDGAAGAATTGQQQQQQQRAAVQVLPHKMKQLFWKVGGSIGGVCVCVL